MSSDIPVFIQEWINDFVSNAREGHLKEVKQFVEKFPQLVDFHDQHNCCPALSAAASTGQADIVDCLLKAGASVAASDEKGWMPLHYAIQSRGGAAVVKRLLEAGADANASLGAGDAVTPLMMAAGRGEAAVVASLLQHGANPDARDDRGQRAQDIATSEEVVRVIEKWCEKRHLRMTGVIDKLKNATPRQNPFTKRRPKP